MLEKETTAKPETVKVKERFEYVQVPTEYGIQVQDNENPEELMTQSEAILKTLNMVSKIYKATCQ